MARGVHRPISLATQRQLSNFTTVYESHKHTWSQKMTHGFGLSAFPQSNPKVLVLPRAVGILNCLRAMGVAIGEGERTAVPPEADAGTGRAPERELVGDAAVAGRSS